MTSYWANFARTGDPNSPGLPSWPRYAPDSRRVLHLDTAVRETGDTTRARYEAIDAFMTAQRATSPAKRP
jgi:para-nitrobenzyl esterase